MVKTFFRERMDFFASKTGAKVDEFFVGKTHLFGQKLDNINRLLGEKCT